MREGAGLGARIILLQERFETHYFCQVEKADFFSLATSMEDNPAIQKFSKLAAELQVVLLFSFFEKNGSALTFYGSSFITDQRGCVVAQCDRQSPGVIVAELDPRAYKSERAAWGLFRDRRPDMYGPIMTLDGEGRPRSLFANPF